MRPILLCGIAAIVLLALSACEEPRDPFSSSRIPNATRMVLADFDDEGFMGEKSYPFRVKAGDHLRLQAFPDLFLDDARVNLPGGQSLAMSFGSEDNHYQGEIIAAASGEAELVLGSEDGTERIMAEVLRLGGTADPVADPPGLQHYPLLSEIGSDKPLTGIGHQSPDKLKGLASILSLTIKAGTEIRIAVTQVTPPMDVLVSAMTTWDGSSWRAQRPGGKPELRFQAIADGEYYVEVTPIEPTARCTYTLDVASDADLSQPADPVPTAKPAPALTTGPVHFPARDTGPALSEADGVVRVANQQAGATDALATATVGDFGDGAIEALVQATAGPATQGNGIWLHGKDQACILFNATADGRLAIYYYDHGDYRNLTDLGDTMIGKFHHPAVKVGEANRLRIEVHGPLFTFLVNGQQVGQANLGTLRPSGGVGLYVSGGNAAEFREFTVTR